MTPTFQRAKGGTLQIRPDVLQMMLAYRQTNDGSSEAGGILLGRMIVDSEDVIIDEATVPTNKDTRLRFFFHRALASGAKRIRQAWRETHGTRNYLGEWHTHPEDRPTPSSLDISNWQNILRKARVEQDYLFFLILGRKEVASWEWWKSAQDPLPMKPFRLPPETTRRKP